MNRTRVLALLSLFVGLAHSFSWDIIVVEKKGLEFYYNGILTHAEDIPAVNDITSATYDPLHSRVLFADYHNTNTSISSFDLSTRKIQPLVTRISNYSLWSLAYDPVTRLLFWVEGLTRIFSLSLKPASSNKTVDVNFVVETNDNYCRDIAVDSCGGFIYWATDHMIERAAFDGSKRELLLNSRVFWRRSLVIDQHTEKMYWSDETTYNQYIIESADLNGENRRTIYSIGREYGASALTVSKDFIYWKSYDRKAIMQLPKSQQRGVGPIVYSNSSRNCGWCDGMVANYTIKEQTLGTTNCKTLKSLILDVEECSGSIYHNYCIQGNCSINAEGHPKCSCNRGYSGERCEVDACHKHCLNGGVCSLNEAEKPVCQCTADYQGERCDVSICKDYCMQGNCSVSTQGQPTCRCNAGYSGERCEVNACHGYCLNNGHCSLNEEDEPVCQCTSDYEGERCDVATTRTGACVCADKTTQQMLLDLHSEVKQVREDLQCTLQLYSDKLDENAAKIQICEESMKDDQQNHDDTTLKTQTSKIASVIPLHNLEEWYKQ